MFLRTLMIRRAGGLSTAASSASTAASKSAVKQLTKNPGTPAANPPPPPPPPTTTTTTTTRATPTTTAVPTPTLKAQPVMPSMVLSRLEEFYDTVLAEDLMILGYDHTFANPQSPYRRAMELQNREENQSWMELERQVQQERLPLELEFQDSTRSGVKKQAASDKKQLKKDQAASSSSSSSSSSATNTTITPPAGPSHVDYQRFLDPPVPAPEVVANRCNAYERIPRIKDISIYMHMQDSVTHSRRLLLNGLLALQLITGQQGRVECATNSSAKWKIRKGMPVGVGVTMDDPRTYYNFLERLVEVVMPKLRDFGGFSQMAGGDGSGRLVRIRFDAEAWQAFPEIEQAYLKFPQMGSVGALQTFEIRFGTTATTDEEARLLLSGFRVPFTKLEKPTAKEEVFEEDFVHEV